MSCIRAVPPLFALALLSTAAAPPSRPAEDGTVAAHEATLRGAGLKSDGPALLEALRKRTLPAKERARLTGLVRQLGADDFDEREKASDALKVAGAAAVPFLKAALKGRDAEVRRRAEECLRASEPRSDATLMLAALGLGAVRRPAGATEVLLNYLPFAEDVFVEEAALRGLAAVSVCGDKVEPALVKALASKREERRAAAAWVLGRAGLAARVVPLLRDPEAAVRWRAAEALVVGGDKRGVPGLLELLETAPLDLAGQAEGLLLLLAGDEAPDVALGQSAADRARWRAAWSVWWRGAEAKIDLNKLRLDERRVGLRLVVSLTGYGGNGAVWELGTDRKLRWQMRDLGGPADASVLPGGRLLVAELDGKRVTERDRKGKVVWEHRLPFGPVEAQRLPGGNTLIATNWEIREVTREGKVVFSLPNVSGNIFTAQRLANGHVLYGLYTGWLIELDRAGKEVKKIPIHRTGLLLINVEVLPGGRYLLPDPLGDRVVELDANGRVLWETSVPRPTSVALLPGGNLLVGSHRLNAVREIDRKGKVVWEQKAEGQVFRVRVR